MNEIGLFYHTPTVLATSAYLNTLVEADKSEPLVPEPSETGTEGEIELDVNGQPKVVIVETRVEKFKKERMELLPLIKAVSSSFLPSPFPFPFPSSLLEMWKRF